MSKARARPRRQRQPRNETKAEPLEVLLSTMRFFAAEADRLKVRLQSLIASGDGAAASSALKEFLQMSEKAQEAAIAAAPYRHSRLVPEASVRVEHEHKFVEIQRTIVDPNNRGVAGNEPAAQSEVPVMAPPAQLLPPLPPSIEVPRAASPLTITHTIVSTPLPPTASQRGQGVYDNDDAYVAAMQNSGQFDALSFRMRRQ